MLVIALAALPAFAAIPKGKADPKAKPEDETQFESHVVRERERARERYREMRERRLEAIESAARRTSGDKASDGVPGWRSGLDVPDALVAAAESPSVSGVGERPGGSGDAGDGMTGGLQGGYKLFVVVMGIGVVLLLALRFLRTNRISFNLHRGGDTEEAAVETSTITLTLRSRQERGFGKKTGA